MKRLCRSSSLSVFDARKTRAYLDPSLSSLAGPLQVSIDPVEVLHRNLVLSDLAVVLLLEASELGLVPRLDLHNGSLQLLDGALVVLSVWNHEDL